MKKIYQSPKIEIIESRVERGFQMSGSTQQSEPMDWGMTEHIGDAYEVMFFREITNWMFKKMFAIKFKYA